MPGNLQNEFIEITEDEADQIVERIRAGSNAGSPSGHVIGSSAVAGSALGRLPYG